jgi:hypothetical protein
MDAISGMSDLLAVAVIVHNLAFKVAQHVVVSGHRKSIYKFHLGFACLSSKVAPLSTSVQNKYEMLHYINQGKKNCLTIVKVMLQQSAVFLHCPVDQIRISTVF